jgi:hypothetical protein
VTSIPDPVKAANKSFNTAITGVQKVGFPIVIALLAFAGILGLAWVMRADFNTERAAMRADAKDDRGEFRVALKENTDQLRRVGDATVEVSLATRQSAYKLEQMTSLMEQLVAAQKQHGAVMTAAPDHRLVDRGPLPVALPPSALPTPPLSPPSTGAP